MSCVKSFEECNCTCHRRPGVKHVRACCHQCRYCGRNIKPLFIDDHEKECAEEHDHIPMKTNILRARRDHERDRRR